MRNLTTLVEIGLTELPKYWGGGIGAPCPLSPPPKKKYWEGRIGTPLSPPPIIPAGIPNGKSGITSDRFDTNDALCKQSIKGWNCINKSDEEIFVPKELFSPKGQLISKGLFFSILPKLTKNFCPSRLGQKFTFQVCFLGELKTLKFPFEINWPLKDLVKIVWIKIRARIKKIVCRSRF